MNAPLRRCAGVIAGLVDCDIHPAARRPEDILHFLPRRWQDHAREYGSHLRNVFSHTPSHPRMTPHTARLDAWPESGGPPASDLDLLRRQYLDAHGVAAAILQPLRPNAASQRNIAFGSALCAAMNDWQVEVLVAAEPRLRGSIVVHPEDPEAAVAEIARCARRGGFVQVSLPPRGLEPLGRQRYRPVLRAAAEHGMPVGLHVSGVGGHPATAGGWPSYYIEEHHSLVALMQAVTTSLVLEGVFEDLPALRVAMIEAGFAWVPALSARLDHFWRRLRSEVPRVTRLPSETIRRHLWFTTQPIDEPERREDLAALFEQVGWDRIMFSSDYPHWDCDDPTQVAAMLGSALTEARRAALFRDNARALYGKAVG